MSQPKAAGWTNKRLFCFELYPYTRALSTQALYTCFELYPYTRALSTQALYTYVQNLTLFACMLYTPSTEQHMDNQIEGSSVREQTRDDEWIPPYSTPSSNTQCCNVHVLIA